MIEEEKVILVDENDQETGFMGKMEAHEKGILHRAFSVFIFNANKELLLQKRALSKYHSGGLWTNTCCSHPKPGETILEAATRRLQEEMGMECTDLKPGFSFIYRAELDNNLIEHELDHVVMGTFNQSPKINPEEVADFKYEKIDQILLNLQQNPDQYTKWFQIIFKTVVEKLKK